jgi:hypothetical protein
MYPVSLTAIKKSGTSPDYVDIKRRIRDHACREIAWLILCTIASNLSVLGIRIRIRIRMFLGHPDLLVRVMGTDPDPDPDCSLFS